MMSNVFRYPFNVSIDWYLRWEMCPMSAATLNPFPLAWCASSKLFLLVESIINNPLPLRFSGNSTCRCEMLCQYILPHLGHFIELVTESSNKKIWSVGIDTWIRLASVLICTMFSVFTSNWFNDDKAIFPASSLPTYPSAEQLIW